MSKIFKWTTSSGADAWYGWRDLKPGDVVIVKSGSIYCNAFNFKGREDVTSYKERKLAQGEQMICISRLRYEGDEDGTLMQFLNGRLGLIAVFSTCSFDGK